MSIYSSARLEQQRVKPIPSEVILDRREKVNIQVLTRAAHEAQAVANPENRPMDYLRALYNALNRYHLAHLELIRCTVLNKYR